MSDISQVIETAVEDAANTAAVEAAEDIAEEIAEELEEDLGWLRESQEQCNTRTAATLETVQALSNQLSNLVPMVETLHRTVISQNEQILAMALALSISSTRLETTPTEETPAEQPPQANPESGNAVDHPAVEISNAEESEVPRRRRRAI